VPAYPAADMPAIFSTWLGKTDQLPVVFLMPGTEEANFNVSRVAKAMYAAGLYEEETSQHGYGPRVCIPSQALLLLGLTRCMFNGCEHLEGR
jgi:hypothetical protein